MADPQPTAHVVRFGEVEADLRVGEVWRGGGRVLLGEQPLRILVRLIERRGDTVTREELRRELWPDNTFVDFEHGLNSAIRRLREALGDSADAPKYIETIPRRGYRFIAPMESAPPGRPAAGAEQAAVSDVVPAQRGAIRFGSLPIAAVLLLVAAAAAFALWGTGSRRAWTPREAASATRVRGANVVGVAPLENRTGDASLGSIGALAAERLIRTLSTVESASVLAEPLRADMPGAAPGDTDITVSGAYYLRGDRLELQARIRDGASGDLLYFAPPASTERRDPGEALEQLEQAIGGAVAIHFDHAFGGLGITSSPPRLDAFREYQAGRELFEADYARLVSHLQRAVGISPEFALARLTLAMAYGNLGDRGRLLAELGHLADRADRLTRAERLLLQYLRESEARRPADALRALEELEALAPRSWIVNYSMMREGLILNRPRLTIDAFARLPLDPRHSRFIAWRLDSIARALHDIGDHERELAEIRSAQAYEPGNFGYLAGEARALAALGRTGELAQVLDRSLAQPAKVGSAALVMEHAARELLVHRQREHARSVAARAVAWYEQSASPADSARRAALARALYLAERFDEAYQVAAALAAEEPASPDHAGWAATAAARLGRVEEARGFSERLRAMEAPDLFGRHTYWRACIAAVLDEREPALELLRQALREGEYLGLQLHQSPHLDALRAHPSFIALVTPASR